jgi:hypothetical protein
LESIAYASPQWYSAVAGAYFGEPCPRILSKPYVKSRIEKVGIETSELTIIFLMRPSKITLKFINPQKTVFQGISGTCGAFATGAT